MNKSTLRPRAKVEIVKQSRDCWKDDAGVLARALDATAFTTLHGDRAKQIEAATLARDILASRQYPVRPSVLLAFDITVRTAHGFHSWTALGRSSVDVLLDTLTHFDEQAVTVRVRPEVQS